MPVAEFYSGRTITLLIGFGPGGGYDTYARVLARHLRKAHAGAAERRPQNMPGAGGLAAANFLYNVAPPDGLTLGIFGPFNALEPLFGNSGGPFDPTKLPGSARWTSMRVDVAHGRAAGIDRFSDLQKKEVVFGSSGRASTTTQQVLALKNLLGAKVRIVQGYKGSADITLAMRRGEVGAMCGIAVSNVLVQLKDDINESRHQNVHPVRPQKCSRNSAMPKTSTICCQRPEDKQVAEIIFRPNELGKPIAAPPGISADRARALARRLHADDEGSKLFSMR